MRRNKIYLITTILALFTNYGFAQQKPQYSQYMNNQFLLNPAVAGTSGQIDMKAGFRQQWAGINDAPRTFYVSGNMGIGEQSGKLMKGNNLSGKSGHGIGCIALKDQTGPLSWTSMYVSYAYHMQMSQDFMASLGASVGFQQFNLDGSRLLYVDQTVAGIGNISNTTPDANLGLWVYGKNLYFGASVQQIVPSKIDGYTTTSGTNGSNQLAKHYFITAGYKYDINKEFSLIPSFMVKIQNPSPTSLDLNGKVVFKEKVWAGLSYRLSDGATIMAGCVVKDLINISYAYDYITSDLRAYQSGSHELIIGCKLSKGKKRSNGAFW
jgi:type IX secretion system PorP/SprF family membrane protein